MAGAVKKLAPEIDAGLYEEMVRVAKQNRQSQRYIVEKALEHYLHNVVPSQHRVRRGVMDASSSRWNATATGTSVSPDK